MACQHIHFIDRHRVGKFHMNGSVVSVRAVIVQDQIVCSTHFRQFRDRLFNTFCDLGIRSVSEDIINCFDHHLNT